MVTSHSQVAKTRGRILEGPANSGSTLRRRATPERHRYDDEIQRRQFVRALPLLLDQSITRRRALVVPPDPTGRFCLCPELTDLTQTNTV